MELSKLLELLEKELAVKITEFTKLGKESKELQLKVTAKQDELFALYQEIRPVQAIIREQNPSFNELFDAYEEIIETQSSVKARPSVKDEK